MGKKFLENFKVRFFIPRKMVLYLSRNFGILKPCTKIQLLRILDLNFWQISKQIYSFLENGFAFVDQIWHLHDQISLLPIFNLTEDLI